MKRARRSRRPAPSPDTGSTGGATTVTVPVLAPRNPLVAPAHRRKAGAHGGGARQRRHQEKLELRRLLDE